MQFKLLLISIIIFVVSIIFAYFTKQIFDYRLASLKNNLMIINDDLDSIVAVQKELNNNILDKYSLEIFNGYLSKILVDDLRLSLLKLSKNEITLETFEHKLKDFRSNIIVDINRLNER